MTDNYTSQNAFHDWDKTASVRCRPKRILLSEHIEDKYFFPPEFAPFIEHDLLSNIGDDKKRIILIHQLYSYLNFTQYLEHEAICVVAYNVSMKKYDFKIPNILCVNARKIYVDGVYHWMFSIDFAEEIEALTGVKNLSESEPRFLRTLRELMKKLNDGQKKLALLFFTTIAETLITPTMGKFPKDERLVLPVRELINDHSIDELRHLRYFVELFHFIWEQIDFDDRHILCLLLPRMLYSYFEPDFDRIIQLLKLLGFSDEEIKRVLSDTYPKDRIVENVMASSTATIKLFKDVGMFDDYKIKSAFHEEGFLV